MINKYCVTKIYIKKSCIFLKQNRSVWKSWHSACPIANINVPYVENDSSKCDTSPKTTNTSRPPSWKLRKQRNRRQWFQNINWQNTVERIIRQTEKKLLKWNEKKYWSIHCEYTINCRTKRKPSLKWVDNHWKFIDWIHVKIISTFHWMKRTLNFSFCRLWMWCRWWIPFSARCAPSAAARAEFGDEERMPSAVVFDDNVIWRDEILKNKFALRLLFLIVLIKRQPCCILLLSLCDETSRN